MDADRFDAVVKSLSGRRSRRDAVKGAAAGIAAASLGAAGLRRVAAQEATPPAEGDVLTDDTFLFVQTATSGAFSPNPNAGTPAAAGGGAEYLLTLEGHPGGTIYFSDRPARIFGEGPTQQFLDGLGFAPDNPPNAALVAQTEAGDEVVVLELLNPTYDEGAGTITYGATILAEYEGPGLAHVAERQQDAELPEAFGRASLFIDDCPDADPLNCYTQCYTHPVGNLGRRGMCFNWWAMLCEPCAGGWSGAHAECNAAFPACNGKCLAEFANRCGT